MKKIILILFIISSVFKLNAQVVNIQDSINTQLVQIEKSTSSIKRKLDSCCNKKRTKPTISGKVSLSISDSIFCMIKSVDSSYKLILTRADSCNCKDTLVIKTPQPIPTNNECNPHLSMYTIIALCIIIYLLAGGLYFLRKRLFGNEVGNEFRKAMTTALPQLPFIFICWSVGFTLLIKTYCSINFCVLNQVHYNQLTLLLLGISLLLLPFLKTVKIGKLIELERNIKETKKETENTKEEVKEFKTDIRQSFQILSSTVSNSINNLNHHTINIAGGYYTPPPPDTKLPELDSEIDRLIRIKFRGYTNERNVEQDAVPNDNIELFKVRYRIELQLRRIWEGRFANFDSEYKSAHLPLIKITKELVDADIIDRGFYNVLKEILSICNYAIHGEKVSNKQYDFVERNSNEIYDYLYNIK